MSLLPVHLRLKNGLSGAGLPSPTIWGAMVWATSMLYGEKLATQAAQKGDFFVVSDAFPLLIGREGSLRFYPRPLGASISSDSARSDDRRASTVAAGRLKQLKSVRFVSESLFRAICAGSLNEFELRNGLAEGRLRRIGSLLLHGDEAPAIQGEPFHIVERTHNQMDRRTGSVGQGLLFDETELSFHQDAGLWFALHQPDDAPIDARTLLRYLSDTGFGGQRSNGKGHAKIALGDELAWNQDSSSLSSNGICLGHYIPTEGELRYMMEASQNERLRYELITWIATYDRMQGHGEHLRKPLRRMMAAGARIPVQSGKAAVGRTVPSGKHGGHTVYVSGRTLVHPAMELETA